MSLEELHKVMSFILEGMPFALQSVLLPNYDMNQSYSRNVTQYICIFERDFKIDCDHTFRQVKYKSVVLAKGAVVTKCKNGKPD